MTKQVENINAVEYAHSDLELVANDAIHSYINPSFKLNDIDFELLSTIRYDPLLEDNSNIESGELHVNQEHIPPNKEFSIHGNSDYIASTVSTAIPSNHFFLLDEHLHRIKTTLNYFQWDFEITGELLLSKLNEALQLLDKNLPYKCRVLIDKSGTMKIEVVPVAVIANLMDGFFDSPSPDRIWTVYIDKEPIPVSPFTSFKTTKRDHYNEARSRSLPQDSAPVLKEVLVYNEAHQVMEGSITNVAFKRTKIYPNSGKIIERWVTPPLSSGCLCGVVRHMLISKNFIEEEQIRLSEVKQGEEILLFNGIIGVAKGVIA